MADTFQSCPSRLSFESNRVTGRVLEGAVALLAFTGSRVGQPHTLRQLHENRHTVTPASFILHPTFIAPTASTTVLEKRL